VKEEVMAIATQSQYPSGTSIRLTAQPVYPNTFSAWTGDVSSTANPLDLIINKPVSLNAIFKKVNIKQTIYETSTKNHEWNNGFESRLISEFNNPPKPYMLVLTRILITIMTGFLTFLVGMIIPQIIFIGYTSALMM